MDQTQHRHKTLPNTFIICVTVLYLNLGKFYKEKYVNY